MIALTSGFGCRMSRDYDNIRALKLIHMYKCLHFNDIDIYIKFMGSVFVMTLS